MLFKLLSIAALILMLFFTACTSSRMADSKINEGSFPTEFGKPEQVLLIQKRPKQYKAINNYIEKSFRKTYTRKFEMATAEEISSNPK
jgi:hypothetical protein